MTENYDEDVCLDNGMQNQQSTQKPDKKIFNPNDYLDLRLGPNETERVVKFRIILEKDNDGKNKFAIPVQIHPVKLNTKQQQAGTITSGKFKSFMCLNDTHVSNNDDRGCPFCKKKAELFAEIDKLIEEGNLKKNSSEWKAMCKQAYSFESKTAFITKGIERGKESEGVKFLRYNKRDDGSGIWDSIVSIYKQHKEYGINIFDYENGKDIVLTLTKDPDPTPGAPEKTIIKVSADVIQKPLSTDKDQIDKWVNDNKNWQDMYSSKPYEYLEIVVEGEAPIFSKSDRKWVKWVSPEELKKQEEENVEKAKQALTDTPKVEEQHVVSCDEEDDEQLPF